MHHGPWYCSRYLEKYWRSGLWDVTLDADLMMHLANGILAPDMHVLGWCMLAALYLHLDNTGCLWTQEHRGMQVEMLAIGVL